MDVEAGEGPGLGWGFQNPKDLQRCWWGTRREAQGPRVAVGAPCLLWVRYLSHTQGAVVQRILKAQD